MNIPSNSSYSLSDYIITSCALSELAYLNTNGVVSSTDIQEAVKAASSTVYDPSSYNPNATSSQNPSTPIPTTVVWGPVFSPSNGSDTYSLMFIAQSTTSNEYFVVIRGTNFGSTFSWYSEDFATYATLPLNTLSSIGGSISDDVMISQATFSGVSDLLQLIDPNSGLSATDFLSAMISTSNAGNEPFVYVTGHSLGGTLAPALYAYLTNTLVSDGLYSNMAIWTFAGLTSGGSKFASYIDSLNPGNFVWRIQNSLDIAPFLFEGKLDHGIPLTVYDIYLPYGVSINPNVLPSITHDYLSDLFKWANWTSTKTPDKPNCWPKGPVAPLPNSVPPGVGFYLQPESVAGNVITGDFQSDLTPVVFDGNTLEPWPTQALYQHHSQTYYQMVYVAYS